MICVSIAQQSHRLALVDLLNAGPRCDLIELRLDRFDKAPEIKSLLEHCPKPAIVSCRRAKEGGEWTGSEPGRLALLRQAVLDKAAYVEIEIDQADEIRRYGDTKRVIAYTNLQEVPDDLDEIYRDALSKDPDVIKLTVPARTPEEAWPILKLVAKGKAPTVAVGIGRNSLMLNILGRRHKAPWTYAALEKGMETYPGMSTVFDLVEVYDYPHIDSKTKLLAVCGSPLEQRLMTQALNRGFSLAGDRTRCLPLELGSVELFAKIADAVKLEGVLVDEAHRQAIVSQAEELEEGVRQAGSADFIATAGKHWRAFNTLSRAALSSLEEALVAKGWGDKPLAGRTVLVIGCSGTGRSLSAALLRRGAIVVLADQNNAAAQELARHLGARYVPKGQSYTTVCDVLVVCPTPAGQEPFETPKSMGRENMAILDLSNLPKETALLDEVRYLGGIAVSPRDIQLKVVQIVLKAFTGRQFTVDELLDDLPDADAWGHRAGA